MRLRPQTAPSRSPGGRSHAKAHGLAGQHHPSERAEVGVLVRSMNCYYRNLIEGHTPVPWISCSRFVPTTVRLSSQRGGPGRFLRVLPADVHRPGGLHGQRSRTGDPPCPDRGVARRRGPVGHASPEIIGAHPRSLSDGQHRSRARAGHHRPRRTPGAHRVVEADRTRGARLDQSPSPRTPRIPKCACRALVPEPLSRPPLTATAAPGRRARPGTRRARAGRRGSRAPIRSTVSPGRASAATHSTTAA